MNSEIAALLLIIFGIAALAYVLGYFAGLMRGKALGWQDAFFTRIAADKAHAEKKLRNLRGGKSA